MVSPADILVVDDDHETRRAVIELLRREGYRTQEANSVHLARQMLRERRPALLLIGWTLSRRSSLQLIAGVRRDNGSSRLPVIMLLSGPDEDATVQALETGADDCLSSPFSDRELLLRIRVVTRQPPRGNPEVLRLAEIELDRGSHTVTVAGRPVSLAPAEFRILAQLMATPDRVHSRSDLLRSLWSGGGNTGPRAVDVHIRRIRHALEPSGCDRYLQTVRGYGYRFSTRYLN